jgi:hypothetical protein
LPGRKPLVTLRDAAQYITKLPKAEHDAEEWQAAMEALLLVAEHDGPTMLARIGVMRALTFFSKKIKAPEQSRAFPLEEYIRPSKRMSILLAAFRSSHVIGAGTSVVLIRWCHRAAFVGPAASA